MTLQTWLAFFVAAWLISLSPGSGAISCMAAGIRYGYRRAFWNIVGLQLGVLAILVIVGAGLGAVVSTSVLAFTVLKVVGALYLVYLGVQQWRSPPQAIAQDAALRSGGSARALLVRGFLVNVSNPKGLLFMLAVLPQFIDPSAPQVPQYALCAATLLFTDLVVMSGYTMLAARLLSSLRDARHVRWLNRTFGGLFIAAGGLLATFHRAA